jgi:pimeloyl-ACP methyl ester carboxylesterase
MGKKKDEKYKEKYGIQTGFSENGLPYARIGNNTEVLLNIEALSFTNEPPSGFMLKQFMKSAKEFSKDYTVYLVGRKQNLPENYSFDKMAYDYAEMIRKEFNNPVNIIGASTGGQIAQYLAANHPDVVKKLVIISASYRVSEKGAEIEKRAAKYFKQEKYGKALAAILDLIISSKITGVFLKFFTRLLGKRFIGEIKYPNDFLNEVREDVEMNFKDRLKDIRAPTLVLSGKLDIEYTPELVRETAEGIPNSNLVLYDGYGHNLAGRWKVIKQDILNFLNN